MSHKKDECSCHDEMEKMKDALAESERKYLRALADYQNQSRRLDEEREKLVAFANESLLRELIVIYDDLRVAANHIEDDGLNKIIENWKKILSKFGVEEMSISTSDTDFDPELHEAIDSAEGEEGKVIKVYRNGYLLNSKVLQTALVSVGKKIN